MRQGFAISKVNVRILLIGLDFRVQWSLSGKQRQFLLIGRPRRLHLPDPGMKCNGNQTA